MLSLNSIAWWVPLQSMPAEDSSMNDDHVYKKIDLVGSSTDSVEGAISNAVEKAAKTVNNLNWFEVTQIRGHIEEGKVAHYQVELKVGFRLD